MNFPESRSVTADPSRWNNGALEAAPFLPETDCLPRRVSRGWMQMLSPQAPPLGPTRWCGWNHPPIQKEYWDVGLM